MQTMPLVGRTHGREIDDRHRPYSQFIKRTKGCGKDRLEISDRLVAMVATVCVVASLPYS